MLSEARQSAAQTVAVPAAAASTMRWRRADVSESVKPAGAAPGGDDAVDPAVAGRQFDELVDRVVEAIEARVVDELERRGVHRIPGVF
jgi:hypothetical protein